MEEPDEDDPGRRKSNPEQIIKAQRKASKVFKKINIKEDSFQQVDKERQALMQSLNKKGTDHVIFLLTNKISQLGYQTEYLFCFITTFFNGHCSDIRISVTTKKNKCSILSMQISNMASKNDQLSGTLSRTLLKNQ